MAFWPFVSRPLLLSLGGAVWGVAHANGTSRRALSLSSSLVLVCPCPRARDRLLGPPAWADDPPEVVARLSGRRRRVPDGGAVVVARRPRSARVARTRAGGLRASR